MSYIDHTRRIEKHPGNIYYVSDGVGSDTNSGVYPGQPLKTIGAAILKAGQSDAIMVASGIYTETGLELSTARTEIWFNSGTILSPATGDVLTLSGGYHHVLGPVIMVVPAGQKGISLISGGCRIEDVTIRGGDIGIDIQDSTNTICCCRCIEVTGVGFNIQSGTIILRNCNTTGSGPSSYGFKINNGSDIGLLENCASLGHYLGGYYFDTGSMAWTIKDCSSGAGDGKWRDIDQANVWSNFTYADIATSLGTLDANNETKSYNVAKIHGTVKLSEINIQVLSALSASITNFFLDIYDGSTSIPISKNTTLDISSAPVGSLLTRIKDSTEVLEYKSGATCFAIENAAYKSPQTEVIVSQKGDGTDTYLRFTYTTLDTPSSGQIRGYLRWVPVTENGWIEVL